MHFSSDQKTPLIISRNIKQLKKKQTQIHKPNIDTVDTVHSIKFLATHINQSDRPTDIYLDEPIGIIDMENKKTIISKINKWTYDKYTKVPVIQHFDKPITLHKLIHTNITTNTYLNHILQIILFTFYVITSIIHYPFKILSEDL